jgi:hypothetical protein
MRPIEDLTPERDVQKAILAILSLLGVDAWRQNVGTFMATSNGKTRRIKAGQKGQSDILGILPGGRFLAIECKRPGAKRPTDNQIAFMRRVNSNGGFAFWATSAFTVEHVIRAVLANPRLRIETDDDGRQDLTDESETTDDLD